MAVAAATRGCLVSVSIALLLQASTAAESEFPGATVPHGSSVSHGQPFEAGSVKEHSTLPDPALVRREVPASGAAMVSSHMAPSQSLLEGSTKVHGQDSPDPEEALKALFGFNSSNGTNDTVLPANISGVRGPPGSAGTHGREGDPGFEGVPGLPGQDGILVQGEQGLQGLAGKHGMPGPPGEKGPMGPSGTRGLTWDTDRQFKEMLGVTRDYIRRTDTITQVHDEASTLMLSQMKDMEKQLGMFEEEGDGTGHVLADLQSKHQKLADEAEAAKRRVRKAQEEAARRKQLQSELQTKVHMFQSSQQQKSSAGKVSTALAGLLLPLTLGVAQLM